MSTQTTRFNLTKPTLTDPVDAVAHIAANMQQLDDGAAAVNHNHTGAANDGPQLQASGLADSAVTDPKIGNRTVDPALATPASTGTLTQLLSWIVGRILAITGGATWFAAPAITLAAAKAHVDATAAGAHGSTSAATASTLMHRDVAGRAKVAAPAAVDDIARKDTVDAVQTNLTNHSVAAAGAHPASAISNTPAGNVAAATVQDAINELDQEKIAAAAMTAKAATALPSAYPTGMSFMQVDGDATWPIANSYVITHQHNGQFGRAIQYCIGKGQNEIRFRTKKDNLDDWYAWQTLSVKGELHIPIIHQSGASAFQPTTDTAIGGSVQFDPNMWGAMAWYFEAVFSATNLNTGYVSIYNRTDNTLIATVSATNVTGTRLRTSALTMPIAAKDLEVRVRTSNASYAVSIISARLIGIPI